MSIKNTLENLRRWKNPKYREKICKKLTNRKFSKKHRKNIGLAELGNTKTLGKHWKIKDTSKMKKARGHEPRNKGKHWKHSKENITKMRKMISKRLEDPIYKEKWIKAILKGLIKRPTSFEKILINIFKKHYLPYKYVGNGAFLIGNKNPDFINEKNKIAIEVFLNYWKIRHYGSVEIYKKKRRKYFQKFGWKTIFINEDEIKNENKILKLCQQV